MALGSQESPLWKENEKRLSNDLMGVGYLRGRVPGVPVDVGGEVGVTVVHADGVNLFFVTFDAVGRTDVVSEDPSLTWCLRTSQAVCSAASKQRRADSR